MQCTSNAKPIAACTLTHAALKPAAAAQKRTGPWLLHTSIQPAASPARPTAQSAQPAVIPAGLPSMKRAASCHACQPRCEVCLTLS